MGKQKIIALMASIVATVATMLILLGAAAGLVRGRLGGIEDLLEARVKHLESAFDGLGSDLVPQAEDAAAIPGLDNDLRMLGTAHNLVRPGNTPTPFQQNRINNFSERLSKHLSAYQAQFDQVDGVALVNDSGVVLLSQSEIFKLGQSLPVLANGDGNAALPVKRSLGLRTPEGSDSQEFTFLGQVLGGGSASRLEVREEGIFHIGAAPVKLRGNRIIGAVILERRLRSLAVDNAFITGELGVLLGVAPQGFEEPPSPVLGQAFTAVPSDAPARWAGLEVSFPDLFVAPGRSGLWARRFSIPDVEAEVWGYVTLDASGAYAEVKGMQLWVVVLGLTLLLVQSLALLLSGRGVLAGLMHISDFLGRFHQGMGGSKALDERATHPDLRRLVRLINKTLEQSNGQAASPLPSAPSLDDVLQAQQVDQVIRGDTEVVPDFSDLKFEGIAGSGTISVDEITKQAISSVGENADGYDQSVALAAVEMMDEDTDPSGSSLPSFNEEALSAVEHLAEENSGSAAKAQATPPPPPMIDDEDAVLELEPGVGSGGLPSPPPGEEDEVEETAVVSFTPEMIAELNENADDEMQGTDLAHDTVMDRTAVTEMPRGDNAGSALSSLPPGILTRPEEFGDNEANRSSSETIAEGRPTDIDAEPMTSNRATQVNAPLPQTPAQEGSAVPPALPLESDAGGEIGTAQEDEQLAERFRKVFDEFMETRKTCGESGAMSLDRFSKRLKQSREAVLQKHGCRDVHFQVYVKNGRAALRATPIS